MKVNPLIYWIRVALLCILWVVSLIAIPLLAKGVSHIMGDPIKSEQYDIGPIPVPMPPPPVVSNDPIATATPVPSLANVAEPVPVPTPTLTQAASLPDEQHQSEPASLVKIPVGAPQAMIVIAVSFILILIVLYRRFIVHSVHQGCAS
jgi:hypothetical protein